METSKILEEVVQTMHTISDINAAASILNWDQETYMPSGASETRAEQISTLETLAHQFLTGERSRHLADKISGLNGTADSEPLLKLFIHDFERASKLPEDLVRRTSRAQALAQDTWKHARTEKNYAKFQPVLTELVNLKIEAAERYGYVENRYDALLNLFEPGMTVTQLNPVFDNLRTATAEILTAIAPNLDKVSDAPMQGSFSKEKQMEFSKYISGKMGFDFNNGRIDLSTHPFCTSFSQYDVRLTTRINENDLHSCLYGVIHETGHGLYEQGFAAKYARTFAADGASIGMHESQSLLWETVITRTEEFWTFALPKFKEIFGESVAKYTPRDYYRAVNTIKPSLIRTEADEVTYNMHIILRYELEREMINQTIDLKDIPEIWNEKMRRNLGQVPKNDAEGCLQDIHWSFGGFGYFPGYTLGKLYAAMEWNVLQTQMPDVRSKIANGDLMPIREWLRENIHQYGRSQKPAEIIKRITGKPLTEKDFVEYAKAKAMDVYQVR
ncbi:MAG: carboxypeptidase M32 [Ignavibacteriae bacterium]|nr:carboxypeptidase M32 [Ignavibacteriota bacterium]